MKITDAQEIDECFGDPTKRFFQIENTKGNYDDIVLRGEQFVVLKDEIVSIYENLTSVYEKEIPTGAQSLSIDKFDNIIFIVDNRVGIYVPENDDIIWKEPPKSYTLTGNNFEYDENNTIYTTTDKGLCFAKLTDKSFHLLNKFSAFDNVTHLVKDKDDTFYFIYSIKNTSWVLNGITEQILIQTSNMKSVYYHVDPRYDDIRFLYFVDQYCTLNQIPLFYVNNINTVKKIKVMDLDGCENRRKIMFSYKDGTFDMELYFFHKKKIFYLSLNPRKPCLRSNLNVTINAGAMNQAYILLATSNGLWAYQWNNY